MSGPNQQDPEVKNNASTDEITWDQVLGALLLLGEHSRRYKDLDLKLDMPDEDLDRALDEGRKFGLWTRESGNDRFSEPAGEQNKIVYELTSLGEHYYAQAESFGLVDSWQTFRQARVSYRTTRGLFKSEITSTEL